MIEGVGRRNEEFGDVGPMVDLGDKSLNGYQRNRLFRNTGDGRFMDVAYVNGAARIEDSRGLVVADFDRDGRLDLLVQSFQRPAVLLMGRGTAGRWLQMELVGTRSNRDAVGARIEIGIGDATQSRSVYAGSGFLSSSPRVVQFGTGDAERVDVIQVTWPSGAVTRLTDVATNRRLRVVEPEE